MTVKLALAAVLAVAGAVSSAHAGLVFSDNFDAGAAQPNWPGDAVFTSMPAPGNVQDLPSVDLVGPGYFPELAYQGNSIDLDGSTGFGHTPDGWLQYNGVLGLATYTVSFMLAGNERGFPSQTTTVTIGTQTWNITPANNSAYTLYTHVFTNASGIFSIADTGPVPGNSNQRGNLLDNVVVTSSVPEASTWMMMVAGFIGLGFAGYRARKGARVTQLG